MSTYYVHIKYNVGLYVQIQCAPSVFYFAKTYIYCGLLLSSTIVY